MTGTAPALSSDHRADDGQVLGRRERIELPGAAGRHNRGGLVLEQRSHVDAQRVEIDGQILVKRSNRERERSPQPRSQLARQHRHVGTILAQILFAPRRADIVSCARVRWRPDARSVRDPSPARHGARHAPADPVCVHLLRHRLHRPREHRLRQRGPAARSGLEQHGVRLRGRPVLPRLLPLRDSEQSGPRARRRAALDRADHDRLGARLHGARCS